MKIVNYVLYIGGEVTPKQLKNAIGFIKCVGGKTCIIPSTDVKKVKDYCNEHKTTLDYEGTCSGDVVDEITEYLVEQGIEFDLTFQGGDDFMGENRRFRKGMGDPFCSFIDAQEFEVMTFDTIREIIAESKEISAKEAEEGCRQPTGYEYILNMLLQNMGDNIPKLKPLNAKGIVV